MVSMEIAPIFLAIEIAILLALILLMISRRGHVTGWLAAALTILAGLGLVVFLLYAFPTAGFLAVNLR